jgi:hypothetical protein
MLPSGDWLTTPLVLVAALLALVGVILVGSSLMALRRRRPTRFLVRLLAGLLLLAVGSLMAMVGIATYGYAALTREDVAARIAVEPVGPQRFRAVFHFPDGREAAYTLAGDEIYVDAHVLKWKPLANLLGLHTAFELDRVAGRYRSVEQERAEPRTIFPLGQEKPFNLFDLRQRYALLAPLLDAEYGSASFVPVTRPIDLELRISTTGLLIREIGKGSA